MAGPSPDDFLHDLEAALRESGRNGNGLAQWFALSATWHTDSPLGDCYGREEVLWAFGQRSLDLAAAKLAYSDDGTELLLEIPSLVEDKPPVRIVATLDGRVIRRMRDEPTEA